MAKITLTFEDNGDAHGVLITSEPSLHDLLAKNLSAHDLSIAMYFALAAWKAVGDTAKKVATDTGGTCCMGNLH